MRTNEERIAAMHARAAELNSQKRARQVRAAQWVSSVASIAAVIVLALFVPQLVSPEGGSLVVSPADMHASIFASKAAAGYVVIGVVAFLLGVSVTIFCFSLKKWQNGNRATLEDEMFDIDSEVKEQNDTN